MFGWRSRLEKTLETKSKPSFHAFFHEISEKLKPLGYSVDPKSGEETMVAKDHLFYAYRFVNAKKDRAVILSSPPSGSVSISIASSTGSFRLNDFLKLHFGIKDLPAAIQGDDAKYYQYHLDMFQKALEAPDFRNVLEGTIWKEWVCDMDWGSYK